MTDELLEKIERLRKDCSLYTDHSVLHEVCDILEALMRRDANPRKPHDPALDAEANVFRVHIVNQTTGDVVQSNIILKDGDMLAVHGVVVWPPHETKDCSDEAHRLVMKLGNPEKVGFSEEDWLELRCYHEKHKGEP